MIYALIKLFMFGIGGIEALLLSAILFVLWLWALIDVIQQKSKDSTEKIIWILVILLVPFIGSILYLIIGRKKK